VYQRVPTLTYKKALFRGQYLSLRGNQIRRLLRLRGNQIRRLLRALLGGNS
jgi:hypothetical protein